MSSEQDAANRRRFTRVPLNILVQHRFESFEAFAQDETLNLSEGGMFLRTRRPKPEGSTIFFQFMLNSGARLLEGMGRVVRSIPDDSTAPNPGMAIEFINMDEQSREVIREAVAHALAPEQQG